MSFTWLFADEFTDNAQILYDLMFTKEFNSEALREQLDTGIFSTEDINLAAFRYIDDCHASEVDSYQNHLFDNLAYGETLPGIESSHLVDAIRILLEYGLNPNKIMEYDDGGQTNIMEIMMFVHNGYQAADASAERCVFQPHRDRRHGVQECFEYWRDADYHGRRYSGSRRQDHRN